MIDTFAKAPSLEDLLQTRQDIEAERKTAMRAQEEAELAMARAISARDDRNSAGQDVARRVLSPLITVGHTGATEGPEGMWARPWFVFHGQCACRAVFVFASGACREAVGPLRGVAKCDGFAAQLLRAPCSCAVRAPQAGANGSPSKGTQGTPPPGWLGRPRVPCEGVPRLTFRSNAL